MLTVCLSFLVYPKSEYDQGKPQSQTAKKTMTPRGKATQQLRDTSKTNKLSKATIIEQLQTPTIRVTINKSTTTEPQP